MTPEQWEQILEHAKTYCIPSCALFPDGLGCPVNLDPEAVEPRFEGARIYVNRDDFADLRRRAKRHEDEHAPLRAPAT